MSLLPRVRALREALQKATASRAATATAATSAAVAAATRAPFASSSSATPMIGDDPHTAAPHQPPAMEVFDRPRKWAQRDRAAAMRWQGEEQGENGGNSGPRQPQEDADPLIAAAASRLVDRLEDCVAKFPTAVILPGAGADAVSARLKAGGRAGVERVVRVEASPGALALARALHAARVARDGAGAWPRTHFVLADDEFLPLAPGSVDLVVSCLGLHWANDLPVRIFFFFLYLFFPRRFGPPKQTAREFESRGRAGLSRDPPHGRASVYASEIDAMSVLHSRGERTRAAVISRRDLGRRTARGRSPPVLLVALLPRAARGKHPRPPVSPPRVGQTLPTRRATFARLLCALRPTATQTRGGTASTGPPDKNTKRNAGRRRRRDTLDDAFPRRHKYQPTQNKQTLKNNLNRAP